MRHAWGGIGMWLTINAKVRFVHTVETKLPRHGLSRQDKHPTPFAESTSGHGLGMGSGRGDPNQDEFTDCVPPLG